MLTKLKNGKNIEPKEIVTIDKNGQDYLITMSSGELIDLDKAQYSFFMKIYAFLLEIDKETAVNMLMLSSTNGDKITLKNGKILAMTPEKLVLFKEHCQPMDLEQEIQDLEGKNINADYNKL